MWKSTIKFMESYVVFKDSMIDLQKRFVRDVKENYTKHNSYANKHIPKCFQQSLWNDG
jgi:hypothetical protein